jgi:hypothetical protein
MTIIPDSLMRALHAGTPFSYRREVADAEWMAIEAAARVAIAAQAWGDRREDDPQT